MQHNFWNFNQIAASGTHSCCQKQFLASYRTMPWPSIFIFINANSMWPTVILKILNQRIRRHFSMSCYGALTHCFLLSAQKRNLQKKVSCVEAEMNSSFGFLLTFLNDKNEAWFWGGQKYSILNFYFWQILIVASYYSAFWTMIIVIHLAF